MGRCLKIDLLESDQFCNFVICKCDSLARVSAHLRQLYSWSFEHRAVRRLRVVLVCARYNEVRMFLQRGFRMDYRIGFLVLFALATPAKAQEHRVHPAADLPLHEKFYSSWYMPDQPTRSCCNKADCYPTEVRVQGNMIFARRREDGKWLLIPSNKVGRHRDNPDGRNHICAPPPAPSALNEPDTVYCFALGGAT